MWCLQNYKLKFDFQLFFIQLMSVLNAYYTRGTVLGTRGTDTNLQCHTSQELVIQWMWVKNIMITTYSLIDVNEASPGCYGALHLDLHLEIKAILEIFCSIPFLLYLKKLIIIDYIYLHVWVPVCVFQSRVKIQRDTMQSKISLI
jgi:hypothetical protein